jgi:hypothetical protein
MKSISTLCNAAVWGTVLFSSVSWSVSAQTPADRPVFELAIEPMWSEPLPGDPLPVTFRLSCPRAQAQALLWLDANEGTNTTAPVFSPAVRSDWADGLDLVLARLETNGQRTLILTGAQWQAYSDTAVLKLDASDGNVFARSRRFWVPPNVVQFAPGAYVLEAQWRGNSYTDPALLPAGGAVSAETLLLGVWPMLTDGDKALHAERLARQAYRDGDKVLARDLALQAIGFGPALSSPDRAETYLLAAVTTLQLKDMKSSVKLLQDLAETLPANDATGLRREVLSSVALLKPNLQVEPSAGALRLKVTGTSGQTYVTMASTNLQNWMPISTNIATEGVFVVDDPGWSALQKRFYRSLWVNH